jgi:hypothetical protein
LKMFWQKRSDLYRKIALENTPDSVLWVEIIDKKRRDHEGIAFANPGVMCVPRPTSVYKLLIFLHECYQMGNHNPWRQPHYDEFLAERFAIKTIEAAGLKIPAWAFLQSVWYIKQLIKKDEAYGRFIDPSAAEHAGYKPKPYIRDDDKTMARLGALEAEPRISAADFQKIQAIRKEYRARQDGMQGL